MGKEPLLEADDEHDRKLEPLRRVQGHEPDAGVLGALFLVGFRQQRQPIDEAVQGRFRIADLVVARRRDELHQVVETPVGLLRVLVTEVSQVSALVEQLAEDVGHRLARRDGAEDAHQVPEPPQDGDRPRGHQRVVDGAIQTLPERAGRPGAEGGPREERSRVGRSGRQRIEGGHHALADAPRRRVDDPAQAHVVVGVDEEPEIGERVLDFPALVESDAADDLVGDPLPNQRILERAGLGVGAVEHADRGLVSGQRLAETRGDEIGLLQVVTAPEAPDGGAPGAVGPQPLLRAVPVLPDDRAGRVENDLGRAVVPFETDDRGIGEVPLEVQDVAQVRAAPLVDRLVGIAHDAQVAVLVGQEPDETVLRRVGVLILVHHDEPEALRVAAPDRRGGFEQLLRPQQEVVEVEGVGAAEGAPVPLVHLDDQLAPRAPALLLQLPGRHHLVLRAADGAESLPGRQQLVVDIEVAEDLTHHRQLIGRVVDHEIAGEPDSALPAQHPRAEGVERGDPQAAVPGVHQPLHPPPHLLRRLVREGDGEKPVRLGMALGDQVGGARRDDPGLPGSGPRQNQERSVRVQHRLSLLGVQLGEEFHGSRVSFERGRHQNATGFARRQPPGVIPPSRSWRDCAAGRRRSRGGRRCGTPAVEAESP